jgi:Tfp pilus assembly protein PilV
MGRDAAGPGTAPGRMDGAGLVEALIALLVLATATLGTLAGFTGALRADHAALLRMRAVDLVSDAAERLRAAAPGLAWDVTTWQQDAAALLPRMGARSAIAPAQLAVADRLATGYRLTLRWIDPADGAAVQLERRVDLPPPVAP